MRVRPAPSELPRRIAPIPHTQDSAPSKHAHTCVARHAQHHAPSRTCAAPHPLTTHQANACTLLYPPTSLTTSHLRGNITHITTLHHTIAQAVRRTNNAAPVSPTAIVAHTSTQIHMPASSIPNRAALALHCHRNLDPSFLQAPAMRQYTYPMNHRSDHAPRLPSAFQLWKLTTRPLRPAPGACPTHRRQSSHQSIPPLLLASPEEHRLSIAACSSSSFKPC